ncbi:hypothetical protein PC129_g18430 [Phytophthora cactorum]|uniref:Uncharacterized protein n=2 Tax=Phytophthora cactorum TaxID=29920 RepID=A0A8T1BJ49_9STRA|nr:hypothetical protein Pcac1_g17777 [Phytophthora cactorum]KAG2802126.1 hypothetical protein PC112_g19762 [Phytophthora cactorum]KAG2802860.1 hypothetical protein PC111_g18924 [Phytophthora cactorum]KAG2893969.1 hypothetical protein PC114_g16054 [Phytophthora cactorum]KAG2903166.1 hypothetical protein PC117_g21306 [Phytophthora cactorum]
MEFALYTMGVELPADLVRDYDMLQLLDDDDDAPTSPAVLLASPTFSLGPELCHISDDSSCSTSSPAQSPKLGEFLLEDELFLKDMEQYDDAINLPDLDMMLPLSPRATSWLDALPDSPSLSCNTDEELESPLAVQQTTPLPVSPLRLSPCDSSSSGGHSDNSVSPQEDEEQTELLRREMKYLTAQKEFLEFKEKKEKPRRKSVKNRRRGRDVATELKMLLKSQENNQVLNGLAMQQKMYADNFKALLAFAPVNDLRLSLMTPLESFIRLEKDPNERSKTILLLRKEKLDMTYKFVEHKTQGMDCTQPHEFSDMFDKFGKHYCVNFTISRYDGVSIYQVARGIYNQLTEKDESLNEAIGITASRESIGTLKCNFMHQRIIARPKQAGNKSVKMPDMESNGVFYCRFGDNSAVLATDYVDQDELHPYDELNRIRKDVSSGVVLTAHEDADGKRYVVMKRYTMTKLHMHPHKVSQKQQDRFFRSMFHSHDNMKRLVVDRVLQHGDTGCSCTGDMTSCCCASDEASIPCGGHRNAQVMV